MRLFQEDLLFLGTTNPGKRAPMAAALKSWGVSFVTPQERPIPEIEETGQTFFENALLKAKICCETTGLVCLTDDSGLEIPSLDGFPGIHTGRFIEESGGHELAFEKLEKMLEGKNPAAVFFSTLVVYWPDGHYEHVQASTPGTLVFPTRYGSGFGYYPVFCPDGDTRTFSQMTEEEQASYSHRNKALAKLKDIFVIS